MQSIFGALLTAGYATAMSAADTAQRYPQYSSQITAAAKSSFLDGADWAYAAGLIAVLAGAALVFMFPRKQDEQALLASY